MEITALLDCSKQFDCKGAHMKKISKDQILDTTIEIIRYKKNLDDVNLRGIAREIGCAHTNIYNYFSSYTDLLWAANERLEKKLIVLLKKKLSGDMEYEKKVEEVFETIAGIYLDNEGWFRFIWLYHIGDIRPESHIDSTNEVVEDLIEILEGISEVLWNIKLPREKFFGIIHTIHCYIIGEITNYISERRIIEDRGKLKEHIAVRSKEMLSLYVKEE